MQQSFPQDGDTFERRNILEQSVIQFFDDKERDLTHIANQSAPQILVGYSKTGPRYQADPAIMAQRKGALEDLRKLRQARIQYTQMFEESNRLMPPIGVQSRTDNTFSSEQEAEAANLPSGTIVIINGRRARIN